MRAPRTKPDSAGVSHDARSPNRRTSYLSCGPDAEVGFAVNRDGVNAWGAAAHQTHCVSLRPDLSVKAPTMIMMKSIRYQIPRPPKVMICRMPVPILPT